MRLLPQVRVPCNHLLYCNQFEYQNASSQLLPLLHTWSLSIEEQYYIIYPVILLAVYKLSKNSMSTAIFALFLFSFTYSLYLDQVNKTFSFWVFLKNSYSKNIKL